MAMATSLKRVNARRGGGGGGAGRDLIRHPAGGAPPVRGGLPRRITRERRHRHARPCTLHATASLDLVLARA